MDKCNDILRRLESLRTKQWRPLALATYGAVKQHQGADETFVLRSFRIIENITLRQVLAGLNPNRMEAIYASVAHEFDGDLDYDIEAELAGEFKETYSNAHGRALASTLNESTSISNKNAKAILWRITVERDWRGGLWEQKLNISETHLEHVFPQNPIRAGQDESYWWFEQFFDVGGTGELAQIIQELIDEGNDAVLTDIADSYVTGDIANMCLIWHKDNISGGNRPMTEKLPIYHTSEGFCDTTVNEYFCPQNLPDNHHELLIEEFHIAQALGDLNEDNWKATLEELGIEGVDELADAKATLQSELESIRHSIEYEETHASIERLWTKDALPERKKELMEVLLDSLAFTDTEFDGFDIDYEIEGELDTRERVLVAVNETTPQRGATDSKPSNPNLFKRWVSGGAETTAYRVA